MVWHNSKKKALYEVLGKASARPGYEQLHPQPAPVKPAVQKQAAPPNTVRWVRKPSFVQINAGRIEFSIPYQVGIAVVLAALLILVVMFRLGERMSGKDVVRPASPVKTNSVVTRQPIPQPAKVTEPVQPAKQVTAAGAAQTPVSAGKNRIVIQVYQVRTHLEPVKTYFDKLGVATEIIEKNNWFYLVTKNKYSNPDKAGTDGNLAKQKIVELGASYKAPPGFETFGPKPFSDAYGMRFEE